MKKIMNIVLVVALIMPYFLFLTVFASSDTYVVQGIKANGDVVNIGTYNNYNDAKQAMNNYKSSITDTAVIKRNGKIVNTTYGIFRPNPSLSTLTISTDYGSRYFSPSYNSDTLLLDYNPNNNQVLIMISGVKGWVNVDNGTVYPISYISDGDNTYDPNKKYVKINNSSDLRLREGPGTNYQHVGCANALSCASGDATSMWAYGGNIYEWLNYGKLVDDGTYLWYQVNVNGTTGYVASLKASPYLSEYTVLSQKEDYRTFYYVNSEGELYHQYYVAANGGTWSTRLGKAPLYLKQNTNYYSFDGNYFYDDFTKMVKDMQNGSYANAINKLPYYNYYQYLPTRSQTVYNADNLNAYIGFDSKVDRSQYYELKEVSGAYKWVAKEWWQNSSETEFPKGQSMLYQEGDAFITSQEKYGVNAAQTLALAITESGWGRSYMSVREYNIFGHGAFDSAPDEYAASYKTVSDGIMAHAFKFIAKDYANPLTGAHYNGSHYGNKLSGNNVSYASDAYWGEKMAGNYYSLDKNFGFQDFNQRKILGIKQTSASAPVYSLPNTNSEKYYNLKNIPNIPVTILEEVEGEEINGNNIWYKIQSDLPIDASRKLVNLDDGVYNFDTSYAYIHSSYIYKESLEPVISAKDLSISSGSSFDPKKNVSAYDAFDGDLTSKIVVTENNVNSKAVGTYHVTYEVTDSENHKATKTITVNVLSSNPVINANDITINVQGSFNPKNNVTAFDYEDGDLTDKIEITSNDVDIKTPGEYHITYSVKDNEGNVTTKTIKVTVLAKKLEMKDSIFYLDYLKSVDGKLQIKGFNTINGINNTLSEDITYEIIFTNIDTKQTYTQKATRITDKKEMTRPVFGLDDKDYTYSWFKLDINLKDLPDGNYKMEVVSMSHEYKSSAVISNKLYTTQDMYYNGDKSVITRNNFDDKSGPIELVIRTQKLANKTSSPMYNQYDTYRVLEATDNGLHLKGVSYSYGMDLSSNKDVTREIIFENINDYSLVYRYNLDSTLDGLYKVVLPVDDGLNKDRAWYDKTIDISNIPIGRYVIYITTSSNITDIAEFTEKLNRDVSKIIFTKDNKKYHFEINQSRGNRIELVVEKV